MKKNCIRHNRSQDGITLTELLVTLLILGIMLAVAIPTYTATRKHADTQACQNNMADIFQREQAYRATNITRTFGTLAQIGGAPSCPVGALSYTANPSSTVNSPTLTITITCPNPGAHEPNKTMITTDGETFTFP